MSTVDVSFPAKVGDALLVHLKLDALREITEPGQPEKIKVAVPNSSGNKHPGTVHGSPKLVADDQFGSCLRFTLREDGEPDDYLELQNVGDIPAGGFTFSTWIYPESEKQGQILTAGVIDFYIDNDGRMTGAGGFPTSEPIERKKWAHVAVAVQDGNAWLWVDGRLAPKGRISITDTSTLNAAIWKVGHYTDGDDWRFSGKMAHVRLHSRVLTTEEIQRMWSLDWAPALDFRVSSPLEFELWDEQQKSAIYVEGGEIAHKLTVAIWNKDARKRPVDLSPLTEDSLQELEKIKAFEKLRKIVSLSTPEGLKALEKLDEPEKLKAQERIKAFEKLRKIVSLSASERLEALKKLGEPEKLKVQEMLSGLGERDGMQELHHSLDEFFRRNHHLELRFPKGTLSKKSCAWMAGELDRLLTQELSLAQPVWYIHYQAHPGLNSESIYLLSHSQRPPLEAGNVASEGPVLEIVLPHIAAGVESEEQVLPVELRPGPLAKRDDTATVGPRIRTVEVLSERGKKYVPLHFDVVGSNTVLNDGSSKTALLLRITNVDREEPIPIDRTGHLQTRFILACEISDHLGHQE